MNTLFAIRSERNYDAPITYWTQQFASLTRPSASTTLLFEREYLIFAVCSLLPPIKVYWLPETLLYAQKFIVREYADRTTNEMESARSVNDIRKHVREITLPPRRSTAPAESSFTFIRWKWWPPSSPDRAAARNGFMGRVHFFPRSPLPLPSQRNARRVINVSLRALSEQYRLNLRSQATLAPYWSPRHAIFLSYKTLKRDI